MPTKEQLVPESEADAFAKAQEAEWGVYVAVAAISVDGVRAFNPGDPVPKSHVDAGVVAEDLVAKRTTKAGKIAAGTES